jgi:hypothetical protein
MHQDVLQIALPDTAIIEGQLCCSAVDVTRWRLQTKQPPVTNHSTSTRPIVLGSVVRNRFLSWISSWILASPWLCARLKPRLAPRLRGPGSSRATAPRIPLPFAGVATGAEGVESPATQLPAGELVCGSASGSCVGAGGSPFHSGAGRRAGLGAAQRMMLGSTTRSFRPPTIARCSILSRRKRMTLRFRQRVRDHAIDRTKRATPTKRAPP